MDTHFFFFWLLHVGLDTLAIRLGVASFHRQLSYCLAFVASTTAAFASTHTKRQKHMSKTLHLDSRSLISLLLRLLAHDFRWR